MNDVDNHQDDDHQDDEQRQKNGNDMAKHQQLATTWQSNIKWQQHGKAMTTGSDNASRTTKEKYLKINNKQTNSQICNCHEQIFKGKNNQPVATILVCAMESWGCFFCWFMMDFGGISMVMLFSWKKEVVNCQILLSKAICFFVSFEYWNGSI